eukprot:COSAG05_NODE_1282_length_5283_cov_4.584684_7_plen_212_part_00
MGKKKQAAGGKQRAAPPPSPPDCGGAGGGGGEKAIGGKMPAQQRHGGGECRNQCSFSLSLSLSVSPSFSPCPALFHTFCRLPLCSYPAASSLRTRVTEREERENSPPQRARARACMHACKTYKEGGVTLFSCLVIRVLRQRVCGSSCAYGSAPRLCAVCLTNCASVSPHRRAGAALAVSGRDDSRAQDQQLPFRTPASFSFDCYRMHCVHG